MIVKDLQKVVRLATGPCGSAVIVAEVLQVIEHEGNHDGSWSPESSGTLGNSTGSRERRSQALLEAAVSSAIRHRNVVETYDYQLVDPLCATLVDPINLMTGSMVSQPCDN